MMLNEILDLYKTIKGHQSNLSSPELTTLFVDLGKLCLQATSNCDVIDLASNIEGKEYFAWGYGRKKSRPINKALFPKPPVAKRKMIAFFNALKRNKLDALSAHDITIGCYVAAISFCGVIYIYKDRDQKTPGTFFEYLIGHLYSRKLKLDPRKELDVLNLDSKTSLPTDFIFDLGPNKPKFHLPVKTSTRERVVQVWAHQRVLDGVYGTGRFWGTLVSLAETKLDQNNNKVDEICLPDQWKLYQLFIAQMKRIYYLDLPQKYADLNKSFPRIVVKEFGEFFHEINDIENY